MPLGLALITVDKNVVASRSKGFLECSYPSNFNISRGLIHKIIMAINSCDDEDKEGIFELKYSNNTILVHEKKLENESDKELIVLILIPEDSNIAEKYHELFIDEIEKLYHHNKSNRIINFTNFAKKFFNEAVSKKMLFIGFPYAGKTCIKKTFFDGVDPRSLLGDSTPEPTRGLVHFVYLWLDAEVGIVDSSGQEFDQYVSVGNNQEKSVAFYESDIIVYVFDIQNWQKDQEKVIGNLKKVVKTRNSTSANAQIYAFCHKIDLLEGNNQDKANLFLDIKSKIEKNYGIKTIFTSIQPDLIHTVMRSMQIILNKSSVAGNSIEDYCRSIIKEYTESAIFLLNNKNQVLCQMNTPEFNLDDLSKMVLLVENQLNILSQTSQFRNINYSVIFSKNDFVLIVKSINIFKFGVSNVVFIRKNINKDTILDIVNKLTEKLQV